MPIGKEDVVNEENISFIWKIKKRFTIKTKWRKYYREHVLWIEFPEFINHLYLFAEQISDDSIYTKHLWRKWDKSHHKIEWWIVPMLENETHIAYYTMTRKYCENRMWDYARWDDWRHRDYRFSHLEIKK